MIRSALLSLILPLALWSQSINNDAGFPHLDGQYGGGNISNVFFGFISAQRGDSCTDSNRTLYNSLSYVDGGLQRVQSRFACDSSFMEVLLPNGYTQVYNAESSGLNGYASSSFNEIKASVQGKLISQWNSGTRQLVLHLHKIRLVSDQEGAVVSTLSLIVWKAQGKEDAHFEPSDILWQSAVNLQDGQLSTAGLLQPNEFTIQSFGGDSTTATIEDVQFELSIPPGISFNDVVVQMDGRVYETTIEESPGISGIVAEEKVPVNVFPNPVRDILNISFDRPFAGEAMLTDLQGRFVKNIPLNPLSKHAALNVSHLRPGIYFLKLKNGIRCQYRKIVVAGSSF